MEVSAARVIYIGEDSERSREDGKAKVNEVFAHEYALYIADHSIGMGSFLDRTVGKI